MKGARLGRCSKNCIVFDSKCLHLAETDSCNHPHRFHLFSFLISLCILQCILRIILCSIFTRIWCSFVRIVKLGFPHQNTVITLHIGLSMENMRRALSVYIINNNTFGTDNLGGLIVECLCESQCNFYSYRWSAKSPYYPKTLSALWNGNMIWLSALTCLNVSRGHFLEPFFSFYQYSNY